jgi:hypothetical protein
MRYYKKKLIKFYFLKFINLNYLLIKLKLHYYTNKIGYKQPQR